MKRLLKPLLPAIAVMALATQARGQVIVIVHPGVKSTDISKGELREVFSGGISTLHDGSHVTPILLKPGPTQNDFLNTYIGKSDPAYRASWRSLVFTGQATMPRTLESESAAVQYVAHTTGAIAYISKATQHDGVKVLSIH
jgi:ABC-type phosphate transport system substrate-binding protein